MAKGWSYTVVCRPEYAAPGECVFPAFPYDLLRQDRAYPGTKAAVKTFEDYIRGRWEKFISGFQDGQPIYGPIEIRMAGAKPPTMEEWDEYSWSVKDVEEWGKE